MTKMPKDVLSTATQELLGGNLADMPLDRPHLLVTLTQHATDLLLNEIERRGDFSSRLAGDARPATPEPASPGSPAAAPHPAWRLAIGNRP